MKRRPKRLNSRKRRPRPFADFHIAFLSYSSTYKDGVYQTFEGMIETGRSEPILKNLKKLKRPAYIVQYETSPKYCIRGIGLIKNINISDKSISYSRIWLRQPPLNPVELNNNILSHILNDYSHFSGYPLKDDEFKKIKEYFFEGTTMTEKVLRCKE